MSRFPITRLLTTGTRSGPSLVPGVQTFSSSSSRFFSTSSPSTNHSKVSIPGTGISENLKLVESVALPSHARAMNQCVDVSSSVDQGVPLATNTNRLSESSAGIGDPYQHRGDSRAPDATTATLLTVLVGCVGLWFIWQDQATTLRGLWTDDDLDAIINHYRAQPAPIALSKSIQDKEKNTLRFPLNPAVSDLLEHTTVLLIEGGPGEGKRTQVLRTLFDERFCTSTGQRPLILVGRFRNADPATSFLSRFFGNYQFPFKVTDYVALLSAVVKRAVDKNIPVYIVTDDVQQVVDTCTDGKVGLAAQIFFGTLMQLSLDYPGRVKIVHIANRMFSQDLSKFSGHNGRVHAYQLSYDPTLLRSTLKQSNNRMIVRHLDDLLDMFGGRIQDYIQLMELMNEVDNEKAYQAAVKQMKDKCRNDIRRALSAVMEVHGVAGAAQGHRLLTELLEEQGESKLADPKIVKILVHSNIVHSQPDVIWASRFTSFVFKERYDEFAFFSGKSTSQKDQLV